ncbi:MAG TPA: chemotaxis protein CheW [Polyangiaceae bacterium]
MSVPSLPPSGLAEEMIPLLRSRLGLAAPAAPAAPPPPAPVVETRAPILEFADKTQANAPAREAPAPKSIQAVLFSLDSEEYAAPISNVLEILRVSAITRVPDAPAHVRGVMNLRGRLLPVVELRTILGLPPLALDADSRVVKATVAGRLVGLLVDRVSYVMTIAENALEAPPRELASRGDFLAGVAMKGDGVVLFLDLERTLSLPRWEGT